MASLRSQLAMVRYLIIWNTFWWLEFSAKLPWLCSTISQTVCLGLALILCKLWHSLSHISLSGLGDESYFYVWWIFALNGVYASFLFLVSTYVSESITGGLVALTFFIFNHGEVNETKFMLYTQFSSLHQLTYTCVAFLIYDILDAVFSTDFVMPSILVFWSLIYTVVP